MHAEQEWPLLTVIPDFFKTGATKPSHPSSTDWETSGNKRDIRKRFGSWSKPGEVNMPDPNRPPGRCPVSADDDRSFLHECLGHSCHQRRILAAKRRKIGSQVSTMSLEQARDAAKYAF